jgi:hypothetical protein
LPLFFHLSNVLSKFKPLTSDTGMLCYVIDLRTFSDTWLFVAMSDDDEDPKEYLKNPYCADPVWQPWHAHAPDVQGGAEDESTSEEEEDPEEGSVALRTLPDACICGNCR